VFQPSADFELRPSLDVDHDDFRGSSSNKQLKLMDMRQADKGPGGADHHLMAAKKHWALDNMCNMQELSYAGCVPQFA